MLDKSIKWLRVILKRKPGAPLPPVLLPQGYSFVTYQDGDEQVWGEIETSAGNFDKVDDAVAYFCKEFIPYLDEVKRRTIFIQKQDGEKVANFTAWWGYTENRRYPFMRWVSVKSNYQGLGLGKAIIAEGVRLMVELEGDCVMYIPTQTWSHKAIKLYRWAGFELEISELAPGGYENQTAQALPLSSILFNQIGSQQAQRADAIEQERQALAAENARLLEKLRQLGRGNVNRPDPHSDINRTLTFCWTILCYT